MSTAVSAHTRCHMRLLTSWKCWATYRPQGMHMCTAHCPFAIAVLYVPSGDGGECDRQPGQPTRNMSLTGDRPMSDVFSDLFMGAKAKTAKGNTS